jgi:hypothetical protein
MAAMLGSLAWFDR